MKWRGTIVGWAAGLLALTASTAPQASSQDWYAVRVERTGVIQVFTLTTDAGDVRVLLPRDIAGGITFYGTIEVSPAAARIGLLSDSLRFSGQSVRASQSGFSWRAPNVASDIEVPLLLKS